MYDENIIEVHHLVEISNRNTNYVVDPTKDLIPLCPNCHRAIHKKNPCYSIDELKQKIKT